MTAPGEVRLRSCDADYPEGVDEMAMAGAAIRRASQWFLQWVFLFGLLALVLTCLVLAGCASMSAYQAAADKWQALADQATAQLKIPPVTVVRVDGSASTYYCREQRITLGITPTGNLRWVLAHELGHHLLAHCGQSQQHEREANAVAVRVLQIWGMTEEQAVTETVRHLVKLKKSRGNTQLAGHNYCAEAVDVLSRYPAVSDPRSAGDTTCAEEFAAVKP
jgi:hypothetical protein